jgi:hypothetical protein
MRAYIVAFVLAILCVTVALGAENPLKQKKDAVLVPNPFDTDFKTFHFQPNGGGYDVDTIAFSFDASLGTNLNLGDDANTTVNFGFAFPYYDTNWSDVHVNANGIIAFGGNVNPGGAYSAADFFGGLQKIAPYFMDLNPAAGGGVFQKTEANKLTITWNNLPEFGGSNSNTVQLVLHDDGSFDLTFNGIDATIAANGNPISTGIHPGGSPLLELISFSDDLPYSGGTSAGIYEQYASDVEPQFTLGPKIGSISGGVTVSTADFALMPATGEPEQKVIPNRLGPPLRQAPPNVIAPKGPAGSNYTEDRGVSSLQGSSILPVVVQNFPGIPDAVGSGFPPDPEMAVGPNHVIACVNTSFRIWDKDGNVLKTISAGSWFASALPGSSPFDPQIIYDHHENRWVMAWDNQSSGITSEILISVSDDDNPIGTWYNWTLPGSSAGDSLFPGFGDYPQMGFDDQALYVTIRQFASSGFFSQIRIIGKAQLYANTAGPVTWTDFWNLRDPDFSFIAPDGVQPVVSFGSTGTAFFMNDAPFSPGTYFTLWKITDPLGSPAISAVNIPVVQYAEAPQADQLGGSTTLIEAGGSRLRGQPVYRDSSLWAVHAIANPTNGAYSAMQYVRFNPFANTNVEDGAMGAVGFWHFYPTLMVTQDTSVVVTFSRSGDTEYVGAFVSGRQDTDPPGLSPSVPIKTGEAHYIRVGSGRNRWGDYMGIGLDPVEGDAVWAFTEYAASPQNTWGTWVGKVKINPPGAFVRTEPSAHNFGTYEVGTSSDTLSATITSNGLDTLVVTDISLSSPHFALVNAPSTPFSIPSGNTVTLEVMFAPTAHGSFSDTIVVTSSATNTPTSQIVLQGDGFLVTPAQTDVVYTASGGFLYSVDQVTGSATQIGTTGLTSVVSARVHPTTNVIIGLSPSGANHNLVRINSAFGDAHALSTISSRDSYTPSM